MDKAFNALFQLDESAVVSHAQDTAFYAGANRIALSGIKPRIRRELLEAERDAQLFRIVLQDFHLDLIAYVDQITRMRKPSPGHVSNVEQAVNAAQVNKSAVIGKVFDRTGHDGVFFQVFQRLAAL